MERTAVVYTSKYGATEKYARWIGEELDCPVYSLDNFSKAQLDNYDNIIYGGGVQAGGIKGFDKFKKWIKPLIGEPGKKIVVFAVGLNLDNPDGRMQLRDINFDKGEFRQLTCYFLGGAYDPSRIKGIDKALMGMVRKMLSDKGLNMKEDERTLLDRIEKGCDLVSREQIEPVVKEFMQQAEE